MGISVQTDRKWRYFIEGSSIPSMYNEFNYMTRKQFNVALFAQFKRVYYALDEFVHMPETKGIASLIYGWDGYIGQTYDSGIIIKLSKNTELYKIGRYYISGGK